MLSWTYCIGYMQAAPSAPVRSKSTAFPLEIILGMLCCEGFLESTFRPGRSRYVSLIPHTLPLHPPLPMTYLLIIRTFLLSKSSGIMAKNDIDELDDLQPPWFSWPQRSSGSFVSLDRNPTSVYPPRRLVIHSKSIFDSALVWSEEYPMDLGIITASLTLGTAGAALILGRLVRT